MEQNTIKLLEDWKHSHKSRSVEISIDNGYGASCWEVILHWKDKEGNKQEAVGLEAQFYEGVPRPNVTFVDWENHNDDWPGLEPTIIAAINKAEKMGALTIKKEIQL